MIRKIILIAGILTAVSSAISSELHCDDPVMVMYINGVLNSRIDATESLDSLGARLNQTKLQGAGLSWTPDQIHLGYNQTDGWLDLIEAYHQKVGESAAEFWKWLDKYSDAPTWFQQRLNNLAMTQMPATQVTNGMIEAEAEDFIIHGYRVLVVAHSQGNFFANDLIDSIRKALNLWYVDQQASAQLVSVAAPTSHVAGEGAYTTLESDGVIKWIPKALSPNAKNSKPKPGMFDHEFVKHYLLGDGSWPKIEGQIYQQAAILGKIGKDDNDVACEQWFHSSLDLAGLDLNSCQLKCTSAKVSLGSFTCESRCAKLCQCALRNNANKHN